MDVNCIVLNFALGGVDFNRFISSCITFKAGAGTESLD